MGAWDYGIFDDDTAYEFEDLIKENPKAFFEESFKTALTPGFLDYTEGYAALVSGAYMDNLLNGTVYRTEADEEEDESNVNEFGKLHKSLSVDKLVPLAIKALKKVLSEESELNELWQENEELYPKWRETIEGLIRRLSSRGPKPTLWQKIFN